jgi:hypothetical protein
MPNKTCPSAAILSHRDGLTLTRLLLTPRPGALPGDYTLFVGGYGVPTAAALKGEARTAVATLSLTPQPTPFYSQNQAATAAGR